MCICRLLPPLGGAGARGGDKCNHMVRIMTELPVKTMRVIENARALIEADRRIMVRRFSEDAVGFVEYTAEIMPSADDKDRNIKSMLLIAYDKGFADALNMIERGLEADVKG